MTDADRLIRIEEKIAHLEHQGEQLDGVVRDLAGQLDALRRELGRLRAAFEQHAAGANNDVAPGGTPGMSSGDDELMDEKPPHW